METKVFLVRLEGDSAFQSMVVEATSPVLAAKICCERREAKWGEAGRYRFVVQNPDGSEVAVVVYAETIRQFSGHVVATPTGGRE